MFLRPRRFPPHVDFTDLEKDLREMMYTDVDWIYHPSSSGAKRITTAALTDRRQTIDVWRKEHAVGNKCLGPFILNWLGRRATSVNWKQETQAELAYLAQFGTERYRLLAADVLTGLSPTKIEGRRPRAAR